MDSKKIMNEFIEKKSAGMSSSRSGLCIDRIRALLDEDSFVEINALVQSRGLTGVFDRPKVDGDGVVTGYGTINGRQVFVSSQDPTVYGGSMGQMHALKISETVRLAVRAGAPFIGIFDTGGSRIEEGVLALEGLSELLASISMAASEIPVIAAVVGPCPGGSAIAASLSHFRFMAGPAAGIYMNGPMVTAAAEGKTMSPADIGGASVHAQKTGLASFTCTDDKECMRSIRNLMGYFPDLEGGFLDAGTYDDPNRTEAALDEIAANMSTGYSFDNILSNVFDQDSVLEVSAEYQTGALTALARIDGMPVGVIATRERRLNAGTARKLVLFVNICDLLGLPLISFVDCEGFAIGLSHEYSHIIERSAELYKVIEAYSGPKIAIIVGKAIGTAFLALAGKQSGFDFVYAWPTASIAVVNPDTAATILYRNEISSAPDIIRSREEFTDKYLNEVAAPSVAASLGYVDEIIFPSSTRPRIASALQIL
ncbi:MAG: acyl-CoA carboxylase subunit beta [Saccharofermentanales bacterium]